MRTCFLLFVLLLSAPAQLYADQTDPALGALFERLAGPVDPERAEAITREIWSRWHEIDDQRAAALLRTGVALLTAGDIGESLAVFDRLVEIAPEFAEAWNKRATALYLLDRNEESMSAIRRTLELEPRHFGALSGLGLIYIESGRYQAALVAFEKARDLNPYMPGVRENIERARSLLREHII